MNPMLGKLDRVIVVIYPEDSDGKHRVTLSCKVMESEGSAVKELESIPPLGLYGTAEELDAGIGKAVANWQGMMSSSFDNLSDIEEQAKAAVKAASAKKKPPAKRAKAPAKKAPTKAQLKAIEDEKRLAEIDVGGSRLQKAKPKPEPKKEPVEDNPDLLAGLLT